MPMGLISGAMRMTTVGAHGPHSTICGDAEAAAAFTILFTAAVILAREERTVSSGVVNEEAHAVALAYTSTDRRLTLTSAKCLAGVLPT